MRMAKQLLFLFSAIFLFTSCGDTNKKTCGSAWVGGEIVNPKKDFVIVSHNRNIIDTIPLDEKNFFTYQINQVDPGIYFFENGEFQAFFLEPGDSLMFRVNTIEFDESLTYSGKGAQKNNFLMDLFLLNEGVDNIMMSLYDLPPNKFEDKMDSIHEQRNTLLEQFLKKNKSSKGYQEMVKAAIDYGIYSKKELYISGNSKKMVYDESVVIPTEFYEFRKNIELGNASLRNYYPYFRCLGYYMDNLAFENYKGEAPFDRDSYIHNVHKVQLIDSLITHDSLKNKLLRNSVGRYLINGSNAAQEADMLATFQELSTNVKDKREITQLAEATMKLVPGKDIPNVLLLTTENTAKDLHTIIQKPTVLYFWSSNSIKHYRNIHIRASELRSKFPEFDFIGINLDKHFKKWKRMVQSAGYPSQFEYQFENYDDAEKKLLVNTINKSMIVDANGKILDGNTNIFSVGIEQELLGYINR